MDGPTAKGEVRPTNQILRFFDNQMSISLTFMGKIFFIEYSNSEDFENEKESNIIPNNNDDEITSDFDNNSNLNDFEFEEVPDNYIEDKIYNNLKLKVKEFFKKEKCSYRSSNQPKVSESNRKVVRFNYCYNNDLSICRAIYKNLIGASHKYLDTIIQHLREYGIEERIHENTGRAPKNMNRIKVNYDIACDVFSFLKNYSNVHGMPSPG
ncbi:hypothetical protein RclHR1_02220014 [Rhizophagus clarus]|uniref:Uncharacterized protein n=1 Tax=Rhizophagus clarus TaxID=94130 RepID=A0A2Z6R7B2_9GLOM|nr:hypothetical protein RclHR1_02220014 [Rhizophagus clarus]